MSDVIHNKINTTITKGQFEPFGSIQKPLK